MIKNLRRIHNEIGFVRYIINRFFNKYHIIELKQFRGQWVDFDSKILYACFQELCNVVENEKILEVTDWGDNAEQEYDRIKSEYKGEERRTQLQWWKKYYKVRQPIAKEIRFLYAWWKERCEKEANDELYLDYLEDGNGHIKQETDMLVRLIKIRIS